MVLLSLNRSKSLGPLRGRIFEKLAFAQKEGFSKIFLAGGGIAPRLLRSYPEPL